ncbi:DUF4974 domain-containing protein [Seonamhaeicola algicola]|uniref:DUF4974 domain-containing protein n=2 Tax=Seonamhaeicola algicola TaxID=1719036 RepID=A0A5C7AN39_9FLAO|nr:DUF4974 domain-containing protein [Seonamhaeicola algicola]
MDREALILKWLNNDLNDQELQAFKKLEDYNDLIQLNTNIKAFKAPNFDDKQALNNVLNTIKTTKKSQKNWIKPFMRAAAIITICFGLYYYTTTLNTTITTNMAQKTEVALPDASNVFLNAKSVLVYNKSKWKNNREVKLQGEAFFKVAKGASFNVKTEAGTVTVYGTQFNVKQRANYFEVICYEGLVGVTFNSIETKLKPGDSFLIIDGKKIAKQKESNTTPSWLNNESKFKSLPYKQVIAEFERQYNVNITLVGVNSAELFTGSFTHNNIDVALKSITLPLQLTYSNNNGNITLKRAQ